MLITKELLESKGACADQVELFAQLFPDGVELTEELCIEHAHRFNVGWASIYLLTPTQQEEYEKVRRPAWKEYQKVNQQAWGEYKKVMGSAWGEYEKAWRSAAWRSAWEEYQKVEQTAYEKYERAWHPAWEEYEKQIAIAFYRATTARL